MRMIVATLLSLVLPQLFASFANAGESAPRLPELTIPGAPDHGIFDPSIASDGSGKLYMSLSGVASTVPGGGFGSLAVRTYLASSSDQGETWRLAGVINPETQVRLDRESAPHRGIWQSEVSALAFDPYAPKQARWRLVWHQYLNANGDRKFAHGWIAYKEAATPEGLAAAKPAKLFTAEAYDTVNDNPAGWTHPPIPGPGAVKLHKLSPDLERCVALSEEGMMAKPDALYLSMMCFKPKLLGLLGASHHVILLKCARPCDATRPGAWSYIGTVLTPDDAETLGMHKFSSSDLFSEGGRDYLTVSPVGDKPVPEAFKGCAVFRFANLARGQIERQPGRRPRLVTTLSVDKDSFNGACSFLHAGPDKGLLIGKVSFMKTPRGPDATFHIFRSHAAP